MNQGTRQPCLYCGNSASRRWAERVSDRLGFVPGERCFVRCEACGAAGLDPLPTAEQLAAFYPPVYSFAPRSAADASWRQWIARQEYRWLYRPLYRSDVRRVLRGIRQRSGESRRLLDIGCGPGHRLKAFREHGFDVVGMDFQPQVIDYLQREVGIPGVCGDVTAVSEAFAAESFDVITAYYVLEHVLDIRGVLDAAMRLLRPGGWFVAAVPLIDSLQAAAWGSHWTQVREAPRHVSLPTRGALSGLAQRVGFGEVRWLADSLRLCAANVALTLIPCSTNHHASGPARWRSLAARTAALLTAAAATPACWLENHVCGRPSMGLVCMQRPADASARAAESGGSASRGSALPVVPAATC